MSASCCTPGAGPAPRVLRAASTVGLALAVHLWRETRLQVDAWQEGETL